ncbi:hypothetical protein Cyrtocomes_00527 [Candidatus Cyrtobacter comes]|uniref:Bacteriocin n=1 Tax=Candidatus Cyrtobacter comes TaxID=675776 RepID=A0ABU5L7Q6_9RICK|nr:hypothetical protein [Candidatus Cyrtobacter comes]
MNNKTKIIELGSADELVMGGNGNGSENFPNLKKKC